MKILSLPICGDVAIEKIAAVDESSVVLLNRLAGILHLSLQEGDDMNDAAIILGGDVPSGDFVAWDGVFPFHGNISWNPKLLRWHISHEPTADNSKMCLAIIRRILDLAIFRQVLNGHSIIMHGAMLQCGDDKAALLFGESGVGKSTICRRYEAQGGKAIADDKMLVTFLPDGRILGQPLPTWSGFFEYDISVNFAQCYDVRALYRLTRGIDDDIVPTEDAMQWRLWISSSIHNFLCVPPNWLPQELYKKLLLRQLDYIKIFEENFGRKDIRGGLEGHAFEHINDDVK